MAVPDLIHFIYKNEMNEVVIPALDSRVFDYGDYQKWGRGGE